MSKRLDPGDLSNFQKPIRQSIFLQYFLSEITEQTLFYLFNETNQEHGN